MAKQDIIVIGASAGGIPALTELVKSLPANLDASVFIVLHISPYSPGILDRILSKSGPIVATYPADGEVIKRGHIYIAPPDHHLLLEKGNKVAVKKGPKENKFRPSVDALFRSAALIYGPRVIGIILSGMLDDGTSGMWNVKRCGGTAIVQDPLEAMYPSMPNNVIEYVESDYIIPIKEIDEVLIKLVGKKATKKPHMTKAEMELLKMEVIIATHDNAFQLGILDKGVLTTFTCPECHGALVSITEGKMMRFRCHTGHAYTTSTLLAGVTSAVEETLWQAMRALEETNMLLNQISEHYKKVGNVAAAKKFKKKSIEVAKRARVVHDSVFTQQLMSEDIRFDK